MVPYLAMPSIRSILTATFVSDSLDATRGAIFSIYKIEFIDNFFQKVGAVLPRNPAGRYSISTLRLTK